MQERRKSERITYELVVGYNTFDTEEFIETRSRDLSGGGICLVTRDRLDPGTVIELSFIIPGTREPIAVSGVVIWNESQDEGDKYLIGVKFTKIDDKHMALIQKFVNSMTFET